MYTMTKSLSAFAAEITSRSLLISRHRNTPELSPLPFGVRRKCPLDLGCGDEGDLPSVCDKGYRFHRFIQVSSRSHIGHSDGFQGVQGVCQGHFAVIIGVVVRQGHEIRSMSKSQDAYFGSARNVNFFPAVGAPPVVYGNSLFTIKISALRMMDKRSAEIPPSIPAPL